MPRVRGLVIKKRNVDTALGILKSFEDLFANGSHGGVG